MCLSVSLYSSTEPVAGVVQVSKTCSLSLTVINVYYAVSVRRWTSY